MSVLQFVASIKWPLTILILSGIVWWRVRKNQGLGQTIRSLLEARNVRVNLGGQELELSVAAAAIAASSDTELAQRAQDDGADTDQDVARLRRGAVEAVMTTAAHWGWTMARMGFQNPPDPAIQWNENGEPEIAFASAALDPERRRAIESRLVWQAILQMREHHDPPSQQ